ncbi:ATP synthase F1 subunit delta [Leptolyngbya sp. FACHB-711]|uniref:ATP synthase F1 subunit delta n=1 Tax=unclassified Leptolyngbya TaxID=2650499 RepID=UPI001683778B|nr:ATP synthase F1 subunit delta [Leptolyngbya sp. FACHB-711]MBD1850223.1 F0F1 ATP synthase subunit delta [Cyanobacteria bacterium FACHB-502]MBD2027525.1 F0F1 ATP synthase subunit delta [Leptolyngbya sp. FACHB-711]
MRSSLVSTEIAEPYAQALMSIAQSQDLVDRFSEDANSLLAALKESDDLNLLLSNPFFKADQKKAVLRQIAGDQLHPYLTNFLMLLVDRGRIVFLPEVLNQFKELVRKLKQTVLAEVTSAVELNEGQQEAIREKVKGMTQAQQVELDIRIDPDLMGGVIIKVGSQVVDASLRGQLRRIGVKLGSVA